MRGRKPIAHPDGTSELFVARAGASMTTLVTSDAPSALPGFLHGLDHRRDRP
jgi:hypothetical protein